MSTPIDLYTYPENATPIQLAEYQLEVMRAEERGEPVEFYNPEDNDDIWESIGEPSWNWGGGIRYRIARPKIAEGHNPDKLTEAQVGVRDGWRLLSAEEREARDRSGDFLEEVERWAGCHWNSTGWVGSQRNRTYRTRQPAGHYLPKPAPEPVADPRNETRRDRIATIVQLILNRSETADQIAARVEALLARQTSPVAWRSE